MRHSVRASAGLVVAMLAVFAGAGSSAYAQQVALARTPLPFELREVMIPMRDGVKLHTAIYTQKDITEPRPIIFVRTPYGIAAGARAIASQYADLADDGYVFVFQDIRGRFTSEGQFMMLRPPRDKKKKGAIDESTWTNSSKGLFNGRNGGTTIQCASSRSSLGIMPALRREDFPLPDAP